MAAEGPSESGDAATSEDQILDARTGVEAVHVDGKIQDYIVEIIRGTREPAAIGLPDLSALISSGASPRAGIHLQAAARANAFLNGRSHVLPEDVKGMAPDVLRHRLILSIEAHAQAVAPDTILGQILSLIPVP